MVTTDDAFGNAILLATDLDAGSSLLSSLLGSSPKRDLCLAGRTVKKKLHFPDCIGRQVNDKTVYLHIGALACMNPSQTLISLGAWCRALSVSSGWETAKELHLAHKAETETTAQALKIPRDQVNLRSTVNTLVQSGKKTASVLVSCPNNTDTLCHLVNTLVQSGHQPVFGLHHQAAPNRVAVVTWLQIQDRSPGDRIFHQPMKMVLLVERRMRGVTKDNPPLMAMFSRLSIAGLCIPEASPVQDAYDKIPPVTLEALSPPPHFLPASSPAIPAFVSPAFSLKMRRILAGLLLSFAQRQFHVSAGKSSALEAQIGVDMCIRQIVTMSRFMVHYGQDATHLYDIPLLSRETPTLTVAPGARPGGDDFSSAVGRTASRASMALGPSVSQAGGPSLSLTGGPRKRPKAVAGGIPLVGQESTERGLIATCKASAPTDYLGAFTWQDRFSSGAPRPLSGFLTMRYLREMTDTVCYSGSASHMLPVQMEFPGLCKHCASGQGSEWMGVDVLRESAEGAPGMTARTSKTNASSRSHRSQTSIAASMKSTHSIATSVASSSMSGAQSRVSGAGSRHSKRGRGAPPRTSPTFQKSLDHVVEYVNFRIALYYPDATAMRNTSVDEPVEDIEALVAKQHKAFSSDNMRCATYDALAVMNVQDGHYIPRELERTRVDLFNRHRPRLNGVTADTDNGDGDRERQSERDLDYSGASLLSAMLSMQDSLRTRDSQNTLVQFLLSHPVSSWHEDPCDISHMDTPTKRAALFGLMVMFANTEGIRQSDCRFSVSVQPPAPGADYREAPVVKVKASMEGFRLSADKRTPIVSSFLIPEDTTDVYLHVMSEKEGASTDDGQSDVSSESSLSLVSLQSSGLHGGNRVPSLSGMATNQASIPVVLSGRQLGRVTLSDKVGADYWVSAGAYFNVL
ncbi:hypothetical protein KIPB_003744 [Kipferlia bialata]|uniref:Uncharacterized protein n=1 Tax=Kipferlia bialata TaxID=797122 RepID=A0A9K3CU70_9EUKA|nr:hypothetical protein KIPB_003744 [Kipferlia bialata]|eukprot:g3744.t1